MKLKLREKGKKILLLIEGKKEGLFPRNLLKNIKDSDIEETELKKLFEEIIIPYAKEIVLRNLSLRDRTEKEIINILTKRDFSVETAKRVIDDFKKVNLIDNIKTAKYIVQNSKGKSKAELNFKLKNMGLEDEEIEEILKDYNEEEVLTGEIIKLRKKYKDKKMLIRYLIGKGFEYDSVINILRDLEKE